jgi:predicted nucleotide-binding protein
LAKLKLRTLSHAGLDELLLEFGLPESVAGRQSGSMMHRTKALARFVLDHPETLTAEGVSIANAIVERATQLVERNGVSDDQRLAFLEVLATEGLGLFTSSSIDDRSPAPSAPGTTPAEGTTKMDKAPQRSPRDTEAETAIREAISEIIAAGRRPYHLNVPAEASRILYRKKQGRIDEADATQRTKEAIVAMVERGALKASLEGRVTWKILSEGEAMVTDSVFIVHGRDPTNLRLVVARFLEKLGVHAIILHEVPSKGRTIITKFQEEAANVRFAVVLMTPDDEGGPVGGPYRKRARQNVVFELAFFIGKLGEANVAALVQADLERPSDFDGVVYIPYDDHGAWKQRLAVELKAASINFDPAKLVGA